MYHIGKATIGLSLTSGTRLAIANLFEVSLDCSECRRAWRTVFFYRDKTPYCTSKHAFDGELLELSSEGGNLCARFRYRFEPFVDAKYPERSQIRELGAPSWARFSFLLTCGACGMSSECSTQSNLSRPWTRICKCGARCYNDISPPALSWDAEPAIVHSRPATPAELAILKSILREVGATDDDLASESVEAMYRCASASYELCFTPLHAMVEGRPYKRWRIQYHADGRPPSVAFLVETRRGDDFDTLPGGGVLRGTPWHA